jgi:hypothetical protein
MFNEEQLNMIYHLVGDSLGRPNTERELRIKKSISKVILDVMVIRENPDGTISFKLGEK